MNQAASITELLIRRQNSDVEPIPIEYAVLLMSQYRLDTCVEIAISVCLFYSIGRCPNNKERISVLLHFSLNVNSHYTG